MGDSYVEVIVHDEKDVKGKQFNLVLIFITLFALGCGLLLPSMAGLALGVIMIPTTVIQFKNRYREYEYLIVSDEMDISVVKNHKKRKKIQTYLLTELQCMAPVQSKELERFHSIPGLKTYDYSSGNSSHEAYGMIFSSQGISREVIVEPTQAMLDMIRERYMGVLQ